MKQNSLFSHLPGYFFQGLLFIGPVVITVYSLWVMFNWVDGLLYKTIEQFTGFSVPGLGLILVLIIITLVGFLGTTFLFRPMAHYFDKLLSNTPFIKIIYTSVKDLTAAFVGQKRRFNQPVLVQVTSDGNIEKIGFITDEDLSMIGISEEKIAVYLPHSYAWSGNLFIVPSKNVRKINASATEVMKYIISAGVTRI
ncbi:MAG: DUF502 domain-containing protein [Sphingobacteriia bacterium]|nr:DUF502 domain-containing protein [Sphingobacteriia bacterium]